MSTFSLANFLFFSITFTWKPIFLRCSTHSAIHLSRRSARHDNMVPFTCTPSTHKKLTLNIKIYRLSSTRYINSISRLFHVFYRKKRENWNKTIFFFRHVQCRCELNFPLVLNSITVYFVLSLPFICLVSNDEQCQRLSFDFYSILFDFSICCISLRSEGNFVQVEVNSL